MHDGQRHLDASRTHNVHFGQSLNWILVLMDDLFYLYDYLCGSFSLSVCVFDSFFVFDLLYSNVVVNQFNERI